MGHFSIVYFLSIKIKEHNKWKNNRDILNKTFLIHTRDVGLIVHMFEM